jgi:ABC-type transporter Mla subunit MlaD
MPRTRSIAWSELKLGIVGIIAVILTMVSIVAVGGASGFWWERYGLKTRFDDIQGLKTGAVVRVSGKEVGTSSSQARRSKSRSRSRRTFSLSSRTIPSPASAR